MNILKLISTSLVIMCFSVFFISSTTVEPITENPVEVQKELTNLEPSKVLSVEPLLGEVMLFAGNFAPRGWAMCDGSLLSISEHQSLFSILGTTYGGDGRTTFGLPKLTAPVKGMHYVIATMGVYPSRS